MKYTAKHRRHAPRRTRPGAGRRTRWWRARGARRAPRPRAAPPPTPSRPASAIGLRKTACSTAPTTARPPPTSAARSTRGSRTENRMASPVGPSATGISAGQARLREQGAGDAAREAARRFRPPWPRGGKPARRSRGRRGSCAGGRRPSRLGAISAITAWRRGAGIVAGTRSGCRRWARSQAASAVNWERATSFSVGSATMRPSRTARIWESRGCSVRASFAFGQVPTRTTSGSATKALSAPGGRCPDAHLAAHVRASARLDEGADGGVGARRHARGPVEDAGPLGPREAAVELREGRVEALPPARASPRPPPPPDRGRGWRRARRERSRGPACGAPRRPERSRSFRKSASVYSETTTRSGRRATSCSRSRLTKRKTPGGIAPHHVRGAGLVGPAGDGDEALRGQDGRPAPRRRRG